ncbi:golgin candidate [Trifolium repens]|nr:golgin candidate [Trifolium repens]
MLTIFFCLVYFIFLLNCGFLSFHVVSYISFNGFFSLSHRNMIQRLGFFHRRLSFRFLLRGFNIFRCFFTVFLTFVPYKGHYRVK